MAIRVNLDVMLARRKMSVNELAEAIGITPVNVSVLKNGRAKAIRFSTLDAICQTLGCQPAMCLSGSTTIRLTSVTDVIIERMYECLNCFGAYQGMVRACVQMPD